MKLTQLKVGCRAKIIKILDIKDVRIKLCSLGIGINSEIIMIKNDFTGGVIVAVGTNRIVIGYDLADKIYVEIS